MRSRGVKTSDSTLDQCELADNLLALRLIIHLQDGGVCKLLLQLVYALKDGLFLTHQPFVSVDLCSRSRPRAAEQQETYEGCEQHRGATRPTSDVGVRRPAGRQDIHPTTRRHTTTSREAYSRPLKHLNALCGVRVLRKAHHTCGRVALVTERYIDIDVQAGVLVVLGRLRNHQRQVHHVEGELLTPIHLGGVVVADAVADDQSRRFARFAGGEDLSAKHDRVAHRLCFVRRLHNTYPCGAIGKRNAETRITSAGCRLKDDGLIGGEREDLSEDDVVLPELHDRHDPRREDNRRVLDDGDILNGQRAFAGFCERHPRRREGFTLGLEGSSKGLQAGARSRAELRRSVVACHRDQTFNDLVGRTNNGELDALTRQRRVIAPFGLAEDLYAHNGVALAHGLTWGRKLDGFFFNGGTRVGGRSDWRSRGCSFGGFAAEVWRQWDGVTSRHVAFCIVREGQRRKRDQ